MINFFDQIKAIASYSTSKEKLAEMEKKGWVVLSNEWNIDEAKTMAIVAQSLPNNLPLMENPDFNAAFVQVMNKLDNYGENTALGRSLIKTSYAYLIKKEIATLPLKTQLFILVEACKCRDVQVVTSIFKILAPSEELSKYFSYNLSHFEQFMRYVAMSGDESNFTFLFDRYHALHQPVYIHPPLRDNPFLNREAAIAQKLNGKEYCIEFKDNGDWTGVKLLLKADNQFYSISFNFQKKEVSNYSDETIVAYAKEWLKNGKPMHTMHPHFHTCFAWYPTIELFGEMLKQGKFEQFDETSVFQGDTVLGVCVNLCQVPKSQLVQYYLTTKRDLADYELDFIFETVGAFSIDAAIKLFLKAIWSERYDDLKFKWLEGVLKAFPGIIKHFNHPGQKTNLAIHYLNKNNWRFAKLILDAGWNPLLCENGKAELIKTLMTMAECLKNMNGWSGNKCYQDRDLPMVHALIPKLLNFLPDNTAVLKKFAPYKIEHTFQGYFWAYQIESRVIANGEGFDPAAYLSEQCRFPDLLLHVIEKYRSLVTTKTLHYHLDWYVSKWFSKSGYLSAAKQLMELIDVKQRDFHKAAKSFIETLCEKGQKDLDRQQGVELLKMLLPADYNFNKIKESEWGSVPLTHLEHFYFSQSLPLPFAFDALEVMISQGGTLTKRLARRLKLELKAHPHEGIKRLLKLEEWEAESEEGNLMHQAQEAIEWLEKEGSKSYLRLSLVRFGKVRQLKKEIKRALQTAPDDVQLQRVYAKLTALYDQTVLKHLLLRELRVISKALRSGIDVTKDDRVIRLYALWESEWFRDYDTVARKAACLVGESRRIFWDDIVNKIYQAGDRTREAKLYNRGQIVWFHGTKFSSLAPLKKDGALLPMGEVYANNGVSFAGELIGSHEGENRDKLSGHCMAPAWKLKKQIFDAATHFLVSFLYATKNQGYGKHEKNFNPEKALERLANVKLFIEKSDERTLKLGDSNNFSPLMADIMRLRLTCKDADEKLKTCREYVQQELAKNSHRKGLKELNNALTCKLAYTLTPEELQMVERSDPIVFASLTIDTVPVDSQTYAVGRQRLGQDIQIAFTQEEMIEEVREQLKEFDIEVFPFEVAFYLETMQMISGSMHAALEKATLEKRLAAALQWDILPRYALPYPESGGSDFAPGSKKSYAEYAAQVEEGLVLPRTIHGRLHAARTVLWSIILYKLIKGDADPYLIGLTAACHDIARQNEGPDLWDGESAQFLKGYLQARGYKAEEIKQYVAAIAHKDPKDGVFTTLAQMFVHDADVLEIRRVLESRKEFKKEELQFPLDSLLDEIFTFVETTEKLKWELEMQTEDLLGELLKMVREGDYPLLRAHLN